MQTITEQYPDNAKQIVHRYIFQADMLSSLSLYHGKMGAVILFYHYGKYANKPLYTELADEVLDIIFEETVKNISYDFGNGMCGIAWGILYLIQQKFVAGEPSEILSELDEYIMLHDPQRIKDVSFDSGLGGICYYVAERLKYAKENNLEMPFDAMYLKDLESAKQKYPYIEKLNEEEDVLKRIWDNLK